MCVVLCAAVMTEDAQQFVVVIDFQNYGWGNMDIEGSKRQLYVLDRYFAERVGHLYLINTGWVSACAVRQVDYAWLTSCAWCRSSGRSGRSWGR